MGRRLFLRVVPGALVVTATLVLTVLGGGSGGGGTDGPTLSFTVDGGSVAVPVDPIVLRRRTITPEFDPPLRVRAGSIVYARGFIACDPGEVYEVSVTVQQGSTTGDGRTAGRCTGDVQVWTAIVDADDGGTFQSGPSSACAVATSRRLGITDRFEWCGTPVLAAD